MSVIDVLGFDNTTGQEKIWKTGDTINGVNASLTTSNLTGTTNQVILSGSGTGVLVGSTNITLSLPQSIATSSTPTFASMTLSATSSLTLGTASSATGAILFKNSSNTNTLTLQSGASASSFSLTLPTSAGSNGQFLQTNGSGVLSWANGGSSPLTTKGDLFGYDTGNARIPVGADGYVLTADSTNPLGVKWDTAIAGAAGSSTWVQYNVGNVLNASGDFTWDNSMHTLTVNGTLQIGNNGGLGAVGTLILSSGSTGTLLTQTKQPGSNYSIAWPAGQSASSNTFLLNDGSGNLSWGTLASVGGNLPVANLAGGSGASALTFWRGDASWSPIAIAIGTNIASSTGSSVLFVDHASNYLQEDNANFFWDQANHRLGIGTNAPSYSLDVNGSLNFATIKGSSPIADGTYAISNTLGGSVTTVNGIITAWTPAS